MDLLQLDLHAKQDALVCVFVKAMADEDFLDNACSTQSPEAGMLKPRLR
jgi:hypothetical protein